MRRRDVVVRALAFSLLGAALLGVFGLSLLGAVHARGLGAADDAFITFRMARNLADGHGLRFNPDGPPVEAASNFLLTAMLAGAHRLGLSLIQTSVAIALVATALTLLLLAWCTWCRAGPWALLAPLALACMALVARNVTNGLETSLFTLLVLVGTVLYVEGDARPVASRRLLALSSVAFALVSFTRPEGPIYIVALGVLRLWDLLRRWRRGQPLDLRTEAWWAGGFLVLFVPYTIWRCAYFGMLLPNTFHAKDMQFIEYSKLASGALYLKLMVLREPLLPLCLLVGAVAQAIAPDRRLRALLALVVTQCLFMVLSGGDWPHMFGFGRFLVPALPLILWILVESGARLVKLRRRALVAAGTAALLGLGQVDVAGWIGMGLPDHYHCQDRLPLTWQALHRAYLVELPRMPADEWFERATQTFRLSRYHNNFDAAVGLWLRDRYGSRVPIASIQAGQFAFWCEMPFFDMFGLVSPEVTRLGSYDPERLGALLQEFDPSLIAFYKWDQGVHHRPLVLDGFLQRAGYGVRYVFIRDQFRAFIVFEKGYAAPEDPQEVLFSSMADLPHRVSTGRVIAALDTNHPRL